MKNTKRKGLKPDRIMVDPGLCVACRNCQLACSLKNHGVFNNPYQAFIIIDREKEDIFFTDECTGCNYCVDFCLYGALQLKPLKN